MTRKRKRKGSPIGLILIILFIAVIGFGAYAAVSHFMFSPVAYENDGEASISIPLGASTKDIAEILYENKLIRSVTAFRLISRQKQYDGKYVHGDFSLKYGASLEEIMQLLTTPASTAEIIITIPEGYRIKDIANYLDDRGIVTAEDFIAAANKNIFDYEFLKDVPERENRLEGYLFPDTYYLSKDTDSEDIIRKMLDRFDEIYSEIKDKAAGSEYSFDEIIRIASIIESEIRVESERSLASAVIYNRLSIEMPLQMCSTVLYSIDKARTELLASDLKIDSPYNTYVNPGLPVGPISNPGKASIIAALTPSDVDYLYFVLKSDETHEHYFTSSYDDFLKAKADYKQNY